MFKNAVIFRLHPDTKVPSAAALQDELQKNGFVACGPTQMESNGWVPPRGEEHAPLLEAVDGQYILQLQTESKMLPGAVVKERLKERLSKIEADTGRRPKGKHAKEVKEDIILELLPKAFTKKKATRVWLNPKDKFIVVETGTVKGADRIITVLVQALVDLGSEVAIAPLNTAMSAGSAMANWLTTQEPPEAFTIDRECELKATDESKAVVRYSRHTLDIVEVVEHIRNGKTPSKLALTHDGRVSFVLADNLSLKKIEVLDVATQDSGDDSGFDADVAIVTGELRKLIPDLIAALGGENVEGAAAPSGAEA